MPEVALPLEVHVFGIRKSADTRAALRFFAERFLPANEVWVADAEGRVAGYVGFDPDWINHLYVHPDFQGQGLGPQLLALAVADGRPRRLWTFQQNARARRFYERCRFVLDVASAREISFLDHDLIEWRYRRLV